ncbi:type II secretion system F family protein [Glycomyces sp. L485]|uniref:type II secretion system F family protein n=1 Tax=Glycomyces sp. L485 TaxID=2909235 RepID=UPI001F4AF04A|nr:type II secretion system F family protein [Glycomyces sp. L485]MCH7229526.1 type II secretion system F family protein [Glycomyces sp. L485]
MNTTITALLTHRPKTTITAASLIAALTAAWAAKHLGATATATAAAIAAAYTAAAVTAWHRSLRRRRLREARRTAADTVAYLAADLAAGTDPTRAIAAIEPDWPRDAASTTRRLATAWAVAADLGAPAAELCRKLAEHLREDEQAAARARAQTASIHATAALLTALPAAGVALGEALGIGALAFLLGTLPGIACLAAATALQAAGIAWTTALVKSVGVETA